MNAFLDRLEAEVGVAGYLISAVWLLLLISVPILKHYAGARAERLGIELSVGAQVLLVVVLLVPRVPALSLILLIGGVLILGWVAELVGSRTGFPFGAYHYTNRLRPQLLRVPVIIPLAWFMLMPPTWGVALAILEALGLSRDPLAFALLSGLVFTAWDLYLDTQMVAWGFWKWHHPGGYYGIPWSNFLGWFLVSFLISALAWPVLAYLPAGPVLGLPIDALVMVYALTWLLEFGAQFFFWGLGRSALWGLLGMGLPSLGALAARIWPAN